jgi:Bacillus haemolytic enterotoxin (HBL)
MALQLATDVKDQQDKLAGYLTAKTKVAAYVASVQNTDLSAINFKALPPGLKLPGDPVELLKTVNEHLTAAKMHAQTWSNDIQPNLTAIPQALINYNATFQEVLKVMTPLVTSLSLTPTDPQAPVWRAELKALFGGLLGKIGQQQTAIDTEFALLKQFNTDVTTDHNNFSSGNHQFAVLKDIEQADLKALQEAVTSLNSAIDSLNKTITGLGIATGVSGVVMIAGAIGFATAETGVGAVVGVTCVVVGAAGLITSAVFLDKAIKEKLADQKEKAIDEGQISELSLQIAALDGCEMALSSLVTQSQTAMQSVQTILDTWATLQGKLTAVVKDLDDSEKAIGDIMSLVDLNTATDQWNQLETFATQLQEVETATAADPPASAKLPLSLPVKQGAQAA